MDKFKKIFKSFLLIMLISFISLIITTGRNPTSLRPIINKFGYEIYRLSDNPLNKTTVICSGKNEKLFSKPDGAFGGSVSYYLCHGKIKYVHNMDN